MRLYISDDSQCIRNSYQWVNSVKKQRFTCILSLQLLEERDTLQLRLSNAIRVNEELRRQKSASSSPRKDSHSASLDEPLVEHPSPSKTDGPVEIAREAMAVDTSSIGEDKDALAEK